MTDRHERMLRRSSRSAKIAHEASVSTQRRPILASILGRPAVVSRDLEIYKRNARLALEAPPFSDRMGVAHGRHKTVEFVMRGSRPPQMGLGSFVGIPQVVPGFHGSIHQHVSAG